MSGGADLVREWEEAVAAAEEHWSHHGGLGQFGPDIPEVCEGGRCMECEYDGCESDSCDLYGRLTDRVGETHAAMIAALRAGDTQ